MLLFAAARSHLFTYLNFPFFVGLSMNKCRETKYLSRGPHRIRHLLAACRVQQRSVTITRSFVIYVDDENLLKKLNKKLVVAVLSPILALRCFLLLMLSKHPVS